MRCASLSAAYPPAALKRASSREYRSIAFSRTASSSLAIAASVVRMARTTSSRPRADSTRSIASCVRSPVRVLRQVADVTGAHDLAAGGLRLPRQRLGESGLAGAVATDQTDPVAARDAERRLLEQHACADAQLDSLGSDHLTVSSEFAALALARGTNASKSTSG